MKLKAAISTTDEVVLNGDLEKYHFRKKNRRYYLKAFITKVLDCHILCHKIMQLQYVIIFKH